MSAIKTEYRIEVWSEVWVEDGYLSSGGYWNEVKLVTVGADDMEYLGRAFNPVFTQNVNGEITLTFDIINKIFDSVTGTYESNYLVPYLFNEAKIKLYCPQYGNTINNGWFDFIIKEIHEKRDTNLTFSYTCQYLPINELSKTGQNLVFSLETNAITNNVGKIDELADLVLDSTDWVLGTLDADLTEAVEEVLFSVTLTGALNLTGVATVAGTPGNISLGIGDVVYVPYSEIVSTSVNIQVIYIAGGVSSFTLTNGNVITNKVCNYTITRSSFGSPTYVPTIYRGYKIDVSYSTQWNSEVRKYVTLHYNTNDPGDLTEYFKYEQTEVTPGETIDDTTVETIPYYFYYLLGVLTDLDPVTDATLISYLAPTPIPNAEKYRTLIADNSNRFNLLQDIAELFETWTRFDIYHETTGEIVLEDYDDDGYTGKRQKKKVVFIDELGVDRWAGFTYGINLTGINRSVLSTKLATKMFVREIENSNLLSGSCSIAYAQGNISKEEFLINLDYFVQVGLLDYTTLIYDLYEIDGSSGIGYLTELGRINTEIMRYQLMQANEDDISLQLAVDSYTEAVAIDEDAIVAKESQMSIIFDGWAGGMGPSQAVALYEDTYAGLEAELAALEDTLAADEALLANYTSQLSEATTAIADLITEKEELNKTFYNAYYRYIQEGIWSGESTYCNDDLYYADAQKVLLESSRPNIEYEISTVDISLLSGYEDFVYKPGDITYIEDPEFFGYEDDNPLKPYQEEVIISEIITNLDNPTENKIIVRNYSNQFDDLFQRATATMQAYSLNEDIYKRADNLTSNGQITFDALQLSLIKNSLILAQSLSEGYKIDNTGITLTDYNDSNKIVRLVSGGIFVSDDGGLTWETGITGEGINTKLLLAGRIDAGQINIISGAYPCFSWDSSGLTAFSFQTVDDVVVDVSRDNYVQLNQFGLYGVKGDSDYTPDTLSRPENTYFALDWDGLFIQVGDVAAGEGSRIYLGNKVIDTTTYLFYVERVTGGDSYRTLSVDTDGNLVLSGTIFIDGDENKVLIDQYGMDTRFIKWFKNMVNNSSFEIFDEDDVPEYWEGDGVCVDTSSFDKSYSLLLAAGESMQQTDEATINPDWYDDIYKDVQGTTRISFHKKGGAVRISVLDRDTDNPYTLTDEDGNTGSYIEYALNTNWLPESYTISCLPTTGTRYRIKFENVDGSENAYIDAIIAEPDYTGSRPSFYTDGPNSLGTSTGLNLTETVDSLHDGVEVWVEEEPPAAMKEKDVLADTNDYTRYDRLYLEANHTLDEDDAEYIEASGTFAITYGTYTHTEGIQIKIIENTGTGIITLTDFPSVPIGCLYPGESIVIYITPEPS